jgi:thioredoxin reductase (NADPH)
MPSPVLLVVDEDQAVLEDIATQLTQRYAHDYRVETLSGPELAHQMLAQLASAGEEVALVLAGTSVLDATSGELFDRVRQLHPHAKRALVVAAGALADQPSAEAILTSIALGRIDYYVPKPAGSPDEVFHQAISSFLLEWATERRMVPHTIHIVGESWSGRAAELREVFEICAVPHDFHLADSTRGRELLADAGPEAKLPLMVLPDGQALGNPSDAEIAQAAGARADCEDHAFDLVIVGSGPAGLSAAVYGASEGLSTLVGTRAVSAGRPDRAR